MRNRPLRVLLVVAAVVGGLLASAPAAQAIGFTVNTFSDGADVKPGDKHCDANASVAGDQCTLRAAIMEANARHDPTGSMKLQAGTYTLSIPPGVNDDDGATGDLDVTSTMGFYGVKGSTIIKAAAGFGDRIFDVPSGSPNVTFSGVSIVGGTAPAGQDGGGIRDLTASLVKLTSVTLQGNSAGGSGGGLYAAPPAGSVLTMNIVTLSGNSAGANGGGLDVEGGTSASLMRLTVSGNTAANGGGMSGFVAPGATGAGVFQWPSTFSSNTASGAGGGLDIGRIDATALVVTGNSASVGGGLQLVGAGRPSTIAGRVQISGNTASTAGGGLSAAGCGTSCGTLFNANVYSNSAPDGSGVYATDGLTLSSVAVYQNTATGTGTGGAVFHAGSAGNPLVMTNVTVNANSGGPASSGVVLSSAATDPITSSTIDGNTGAGTNGLVVLPAAAAPQVSNTIVSGAGANCQGTIVSLGNNLETGNTCGFSLPTDKVNTDPQFEKITVADDNGGFTKTRLLKPTSPAIDAGSLTGCPATDARLVLRPEGTKCDIGAYEVSPGTRNSDVQVNGLSASPASVARGANVTYTMTVVDKGPLDSFETVLTDALPAGLVFQSCSATGGASCVQSGGLVTVTWAAGLTVNTNQTVTVVAMVDPAASASSIGNTFTADSTNPDHYPCNNTATATVAVTA